MYDVAHEVVSIADACLGGLQGRSALLIGPEEQLSPFIKLLQHANMKCIYQEDTPLRVSYLLPSVQLLIIQPSHTHEMARPVLSAATIAKGCEGRHTPLLIMDLAAAASVEEMAGLLPTVCLYTPDDLRGILAKQQAKAS
jgi:glutamyl-tRNA reductase